MQKPQVETSTSGLRGDYAGAGPDYVVDQRLKDYTPEEHALWRTLYTRQSALMQDYASAEFRAGLALLDAGDGIPDFAAASRRLSGKTGWTLVAVPGFIPDDVFFSHLAARRFPVTRWLRTPEEIDYLVEPDVFHDFFGHVPMLTDPVFADFLQLYGRLGEQALALGALKMLARLYWYTVEFGLIRTNEGLRSYGAGILSSAGETVYCIQSQTPQRVAFDVERVMRTNYMIDSFQKTYFVIDGTAQLFDALRTTDFAALYRQYRDEPGYAPDAQVPGDRRIHI